MRRMKSMLYSKGKIVLQRIEECSATVTVLTTLRFLQSCTNCEGHEGQCGLTIQAPGLVGLHHLQFMVEVNMTKTGETFLQYVRNVSVYLLSCTLIENR